MENPVIIFGAGSLGVQALDIFQRNGVLVYGFLDDEKELHSTTIDDTAVLGDTDDGGFLKLIGPKCEAFIAIGERSVREQLVEMLNERRKTMPVNAIHDSAVVSRLADIGHGNLVATRAVVGPQVRLGSHCIVQAGAIVEALARVGDYVHIGPGALIGSRAELGEGAFIGMGAVVVAGIKIGKNARIGAGSVVVENVPEESTVFGNPAKRL